MELHYNCKTCGKSFGFGRMSREPAECNNCNPPPLYTPEPSDYELGWQDCEARIIKLLEERSDVVQEFAYAIALIKDPTRNITSEILPDGSIHIEEIKGETK